MPTAREQLCGSKQALGQRASEVCLASKRIRTVISSKFQSKRFLIPSFSPWKED